MKHVVLALALVGQSAPQSMPPAEQIKLTPAPEIDINLTKLKGTLIRQLAWSPDATELYLMTYEPNRDASIKEAFHFLIPLTGGAAKRVDVQPPWAVEYWKWKSDRTAPGDPSLSIEVLQEKRRQNAVALPMGGEMARGGTSAAGTNGLSEEAALEAARAMRNDDVYSLKLKGEIVGEWINHPIVPGQTFGWGPASTGLIAFSERSSGRLVLMDKQGKQRVNDTKNVIVPAWTTDGTKLAYLEGRGRGRFALFVATVAK